MKILIIIVSTVVILSTCRSSTSLHPIVLIPGNAGNQLEARLTDEYESSSSSCTRDQPAKKDKDGWFQLWLDLNVLIGSYTECFASRMTTYYDAEVDDYQNAPGVETRVVKFGSTESMLYLNTNPIVKSLTTYMAVLVKALQNIGYVDGETLFGAPYDFRYSLAAEGHPSHVGSKYLQDLKELIEKASFSNGQKPVILMSHSLGGLYVLQLLNRNSLPWRKKYVKHVIALCTPWAGASLEMFMFASGYSLGVPFVDPLLLREEEKSSESNLWLMPTRKYFGHEKPLIVTPNKTYTSYDIPEFLNDIGITEVEKRYNLRIMPLVEKLPPTEVPVTCIIGTGIDTIETSIYGEKGFDEKPKILYGDGDGTVNAVSLLALESEWKYEKNQKLKMIKVNGSSHTGILKDDMAIHKILGEVHSINSEIMLPVMRLSS